MGSQEQTFFIAMIIAIICSLVIVFYFAFSIIRNQRRYIRLQQKLLRAEVETLEKERKRIAEDLHDDVGPLLSSVKLNLNSLDIEDETDQKTFKNINTIIDRVIADIRTTSHNLMPYVLVKKGLMEAVEDFADKLNNAQEVAVHFDDQTSGRDFSEEQKLNLYRVVQETVNNALKHAQARNIFIEATETQNSWKMTIRDDGRGFDYQQKKRDAGGLGLKNVRSRVDLLGGKLNYHSAPGAGTSITVTLPAA